MYTMEEAATTALETGKVIDKNVGSTGSVRQLSEKFTGEFFPEGIENDYGRFLFEERIRESTLAHSHPVFGKPDVFETVLSRMMESGELPSDFVLRPSRADIKSTIALNPAQEVVVTREGVVVTQLPTALRDLTGAQRRALLSSDTMRNIWLSGEGEGVFDKFYSGVAEKRFDAFTKMTEELYWEKTTPEMTQAELLRASSEADIIAQSRADTAAFAHIAKTLDLDVSFVRNVNLETGVGRVEGFSPQALADTERFFGKGQSQVDFFVQEARARAPSTSTGMPDLITDRIQKSIGLPGKKPGIDFEVEPTAREVNWGMGEGYPKKLEDTVGKPDVFFHATDAQTVMDLTKSGTMVINSEMKGIWGTGALHFAGPGELKTSFLGGSNPSFVEMKFEPGKGPMSQGQWIEHGLVTESAFKGGVGGFLKRILGIEEEPGLYVTSKEVWYPPKNIEQMRFRTGGLIKIVETPEWGGKMIKGGSVLGKRGVLNAFGPDDFIIPKGTRLEFTKMTYMKNPLQPGNWPGEADWLPVAEVRIAGKGARYPRVQAEAYSNSWMTDEARLPGAKPFSLSSKLSPEPFIERQIIPPRRVVAAGYPKAATVESIWPRGMDVTTGYPQTYPMAGIPVALGLGGYPASLITPTAGSGYPVATLKSSSYQRAAPPVLDYSRYQASYTEKPAPVYPTRSSLLARPAGYPASGYIPRPINYVPGYPTVVPPAYPPARYPPERIPGYPTSRPPNYPPGYSPGYPPGKPPEYPPGYPPGYPTKTPLTTTIRTPPNWIITTWTTPDKRYRPKRKKKRQAEEWYIWNPVPLFETVFGNVSGGYQQPWPSRPTRETQYPKEAWPGQWPTAARQILFPKPPKRKAVRVPAYFSTNRGL
jgi:hypothetical protein